MKIDVTWSQREPPADFADAFSLEGPEEDWLTNKEYYADGALAIHIRNHIPGSQLKTARLRDPIPPSMFEFSRRYLRDPIDSAVARIGPMVPA